ncbi:MAG: pseudaminic acid synthase [Candidatus Magasanikbacteria bacterium RIFOXYC12_FULL_33_11]|uniref:Pseudaminic acid synthase n=1 Tax=Candidatus Magasanikbacteria bacterium RIFOXYC12_FULL_33_11 TaxID=1798701 RepID=A0A1F6NMH3_9BACT|nr:MAG: pseudaminic acid synthase [Candidatus Magasanikbacteria bacterium RIFOXYC12_FULL_33_11]
MEEIIIQTPKGERKIGPGNPAFIIAEMSGNHNQNFERAVEIIKFAAEAGADAIKLQTYTPDTMTIDCQKEYFMVAGEGNPDIWKGKTLYELYQKAYTPWEWHPKLKKIAEDLGLVFFSSPFDETAVDFLETLNVPCYKIASYEATDVTLLRKVASTGKPVIMSVGFATLEEIEEATSVLKQYGTKELVVLHCVTAYSNNPIPEQTNLRTMIDIKDRFQVVCGFSDNNAGIEIPLQAVSMGASVIEKHVTIKGDNSGVDEDFSVDQNEFKNFVESVRRIELIMGDIHYGTQGPAEEYNKRFRRSLFVVKDIKKGENFTIDNIRVIRPAMGLLPKYYYEVIGGKKAFCDIERGTPLSVNLIDGGL